MPEVAVIVPSLDDGASLPDCLDALQRQDIPDSRFEVIVVDGLSKDGSARMARSMGARVLLDGSAGPGAARNAGAAASNAPILAFTDADCVPREDWLRRIVEVFAEHPEADGVAGALRMPRSTLLGRLEDNDAQLHYRGYITSNVAYRREAFLRVGGFAPGLVCCEDYDLAWRMMDAGSLIVQDPRPVVVHAPPEVAGSVGRYLRKQFWYARHDVPAHARALARGSRHATPGGIDALRGSALAASLAGGLLMRRPPLALAGTAGLMGGPMRSAVRGARRFGGPPWDAPKLAAIAGARRVVRGAGTLVGLADFALPSAWSELSARVGALGPPR